MRVVSLLQPRRIVIGNGCAAECVGDMVSHGARSVFLACDPNVVGPAGPLVDGLRAAGLGVTVYAEVAAEPTIRMFEDALAAARACPADAFVGVGGGSVLDVAKLLAALSGSRQTLADVFGVGKLAGRSSLLACLPTTAGTGSEVSPNAILADPAERLKKGVVSPHLVPDAAYVDPLLAVTLPPAVTATTGMDALTHCIEAYANRNAHPAVDPYALAGVRLIGASLERAVADGRDVEARGRLALGSLYGGLCLGPVNTAAVHALAYPLGGQFGVPHGLANAVLLPHVLAFNLDAAADRYADLAAALGARPHRSPAQTARAGLERIRELSRRCGIPGTLSELGIPQEAIGPMAAAAMTVTRLLKNNPRELTAGDAEDIYRSAF